MKRNLLLFATLLLLFSSIGSQVQSQPTARPNSGETEIPMDKKVKMGKLENGLTYIIRENKQPQGRAEFQLALKAGSILEDEDQVGLAHFTEHMAFNGTKYYPGNEMVDLLEKKGISFGREINAYTGFDQTVYTLTLPQTTPEYLDLGFKALDGWACGLLMDAKEIDQERGVILEEWRQRLGAAERLREATWATMLKGSRYIDRLPIGTEQNLRNFKHETIRRFYADWYRPDLMAVILVGDFDATEMEQKVKEIFGVIPMPQNPKERIYYGIPDNKDPLIVVATDKEATNSSLSFFWKHKKKEIKTINDLRNIEFPTDLFNGMMSSRLAELAEKSDAPFIGARAGYGSYITPKEDVFSVSSRPKNNQADKTIQVLFRELVRVKQHGFLESELERQKEALLSRYEKEANEESKATSSALASRYVDYFIDHMPAPGADAEYEYAKSMIDQISLDEINSLINSWMTSENFVLSLTGPESKDVKFPSEKEIRAIYEQVLTESTEPWIDTYVPQPLITEILHPAQIVSRVENTEMGFTELTLANGVKVVLMPTQFQNDQILMSSFSPGGTSVYPDDKVVTAMFTANIINISGLGEFDNNQLTKKLKSKNLSCVPAIRELSQGISGNSTGKDFETLMQLTYLFYKSPRKDQEAFDRYTNNLKNQIRFTTSNPQVVFVKKIKESIYPEDKRSVYVPTIEQIEQMKLDDVYQIYTERFGNAGDDIFFFVGNFQIDSILPVIQQYLGNLPSTNEKENWIDRSTPFAKGKVEAIVEVGAEKQGNLAIFHQVDYQWDETENIGIEVLSNALKITVREIIREKIGGTYSPNIDVRVEKLPNPKVFLEVYITCNPDNAATLKKETLKILASYIKKGIDEVTLSKVKEQLISSYKKNYQEENRFWLNALYGHYSMQNSMPNLANYEKKVKDVSIEDIKVLSKKYLDMKSYVTVIQKPEKVAK